MLTKELRQLVIPSSGGLPWSVHCDLEGDSNRPSKSFQKRPPPPPPGETFQKPTLAETHTEDIGFSFPEKGTASNTNDSWVTDGKIVGLVLPVKKACQPCRELCHLNVRGDSCVDSWQPVAGEWRLFFRPLSVKPGVQVIQTNGQRFSMRISCARPDDHFYRVRVSQSP